MSLYLGGRKKNFLFSHIFFSQKQSRWLDTYTKSSTILLSLFEGAKLDI